VLVDFELDTGFALAGRKVRHQFEKRNFKSDRNPLKYRDIITGMGCSYS